MLTISVLNLMTHFYQTLATKEKKKDWLLKYQDFQTPVQAF
jgi:hypothetical protein